MDWFTSIVGLKDKSLPKILNIFGIIISVTVTSLIGAVIPAFIVASYIFGVTALVIYRDFYA
ncbi:MAG: hypothetical protein A2086_08435 [Spirochaetes bacterium GWD1_27_9]|nr:MAG: hypothetical protein A2Z98_00210 [Spirochaetes bacterium GWB1_27_13]OHD20828.1 MAG: hypothetical protein A2Y34_12710 [Spirochaetes bacterium GWC1_27_15]OHD30609.1 MAG: hypothetical protein A2086_08435 [Spirochaetes bacterium GWD1_27_9]